MLAASGPRGSPPARATVGKSKRVDSSKLSKAVCHSVERLDTGESIRHSGLRSAHEWNRNAQHGRERLSHAAHRESSAATSVHPKWGSTHPVLARDRRSRWRRTNAVGPRGETGVRLAGGHRGNEGRLATGTGPVRGAALRDGRR